MNTTIARAKSGSDWRRTAIGAFLGVSFGSAMAMWLGACPTCEHPQLMTVPYIGSLPMLGSVFSGLLVALWWRTVRLERSGELGRASKSWSSLLPVVSLALLFGAILVAAFAAIAIKPCALCSVFWSALALSALVGVLGRLHGSWVFYPALGSALVATWLILATPFQFTVHAFLSSYVARLGLPPGAAWPSSLRVQGIDTYVVLGNCSPCNAKSGQSVIDALHVRRPHSTAVLSRRDARAGIRVPTGLFAKDLDDADFRVMGLHPDSPPYVFEVRDTTVVVCQAASLYVGRLDRQKVAGK